MTSPLVIFLLIATLFISMVLSSNVIDSLQSNIIGTNNISAMVTTTEKIDWDFEPKVNHLTELMPHPLHLMLTIPQMSPDPSDIQFNVSFKFYGIHCLRGGDYFNTWAKLIFRFYEDNPTQVHSWDFQTTNDDDGFIVINGRAVVRLSNPPSDLITAELILPSINLVREDIKAEIEFGTVDGAKVWKQKFDLPTFPQFTTPETSNVRYAVISENTRRFSFKYDNALTIPTSKDAATKLYISAGVAASTYDHQPFFIVSPGSVDKTQCSISSKKNPTVVKARGVISTVYNHIMMLQVPAGVEFVADDTITIDCSRSDFAVRYYDTNWAAYRRAIAYSITFDKIPTETFVDIDSKSLPPVGYLWAPAFIDSEPVYEWDFNPKMSMIAQQGPIAHPFHIQLVNLPPEQFTYKTLSYILKKLRVDGMRCGLPNSAKLPTIIMNVEYKDGQRETFNYYPEFITTPQAPNGCQLKRSDFSFAAEGVDSKLPVSYTIELVLYPTEIVSPSIVVEMVLFHYMHNYSDRKIVSFLAPFPTIDVSPPIFTAPALEWVNPIDKNQKRFKMTLTAAVDSPVAQDKKGGLKLYISSSRINNEITKEGESFFTFVAKSDKDQRKCKLSINSANGKGNVVDTTVTPKLDDDNVGMMYFNIPNDVKITAGQTVTIDCSESALTVTVSDHYEFLYTQPIPFVLSYNTPAEDNMIVINDSPLPEAKLAMVIATPFNSN